MGGTGNKTLLLITVGRVLGRGSCCSLRSAMSVCLFVFYCRSHFLESLIILTKCNRSNISFTSRKIKQHIITPPWLLSTALCLAANPLRWCTISDAEQNKCSQLRECLKNELTLTCVKKPTYMDCIKAIAVSDLCKMDLNMPGGYYWLQ